MFQCEGLARPLKILAPTIFVFAILGVFRGFFQGKRTMMPTAFSQVFEQIVNAIVSITAAYSFMKAHSASAQISSYGAAGGTLGTLFGAITALLFLIFIFMIYRPVLHSQLHRDPMRELENTSHIYTVLAMTIIPIILSQTVYQISGPIDNALFGHLAADKGEQLGVYSAQYRTLINVPVAVSSAMASSLIPSIVASLSKNDHKKLKLKVGTSIKFNMAIAIPSAVGLMVLAKPVIHLLYPSLIENASLSSKMLMYGSIAVVFYALSTITSAVLQGIDKLRLPVIHSAVSLGIHVVIVFLLLKFTNIGIYALVIGNVTFPLVVCILNWISVGRYLTYKQEVVKTFAVPLLCSVIMGITAWGSYQVAYHSIHSNLFAILFSMAMGVIIYFVFILLFKCFTEEEFYDIPMGRTIIRVAKKIKLM